MSFSSQCSSAAAMVRAVLPERGNPGRLLTAVEQVESSPRADGLIDALRSGIHALPVGQRTRDVLHGQWLGHPLHPMTVQVPLGAWTSAAVLDMVPGARRSAAVLVAAGLAAALPAAVTGATDWSDLRKPQMRVGLVHAAANWSAVALYTGSLAARLRGRHVRGRAWGLAGLAAVGVGGALGGHMSFRQASGANHAEQVPAVVEPGWHALGRLEEFTVGHPVRRSVGEVPVVVVREEYDVVRVLAERCSHMAGPLSQGEVSDGCIRCPWHGSVFRLSDGHNVHGPATAPQPVFETLLSEGKVSARLSG